MFSRIKNAIKKNIINPAGMFFVKSLKILPEYEIFEKTYGHRNSVFQKQSVNPQGEIPWFTYPSLDYISQLNLTDKVIFEWGSGNSSLYFSKLCKNIISVEDDENWYNTVSKNQKDNQKLVLHKDATSYIKSIHDYNCKFDIIIVDGKYRAECASEAIQCLAENGMIILDNSDWYKNTSKFLRSQNLIEIDFHGLGPINNYTWTTSFFLTRSFNFDPIDQQPKSLPFSVKNIED